MPSVFVENRHPKPSLNDEWRQMPIGHWTIIEWWIFHCHVNSQSGKSKLHQFGEDTLLELFVFQTSQANSRHFHSMFGSWSKDGNRCTWRLSHVQYVYGKNIPFLGNWIAGLGDFNVIERKKVPHRVFCFPGTSMKVDCFKGILAAPPKLPPPVIRG